MRPVSFGAYVFSASGIGIAESDPSFEMQSQAIAIPRADGAWDGFGSTQSPSAARRYAVNFFVEETASLKVDQQVDAFLKEARNGLQWLSVVMHDGTYRQSLVKCGRVAMPRQPAHLFHLPITATFEMLEPYWYGADQNEQLTIVTATPAACDLTNQGTAPLVKAILRFTGTANRPKFVNNTNGYSIELNRNITTSKVVEINLGAQTVTYDGADDFANVVLSATQIGLFKFNVGANDVDFIAAGGGTPNGTVQFLYRWMYD